MKLPFLSKPSGNPLAFLTIDIGTDSIKCCALEVSEFDSHVSLNVVGVAKENLPLGAVNGGVVVNEEVVKDALSKAVVLATDSLDYKVSDAVFGVSGDLSFGSMTTVRLTRSEVCPITKRELKKINDKIFEAAYNQALSDLLEKTGSSDLDIELVTSSAVYMKVDGKSTFDPIGAEAETLEVALFTSFTPTYHVDILQRLAKQVGLRIVAIGSEMYALAKLLSRRDDIIPDFVIMDVGADVTDVGVVFAQGIVSTRSLLMGGRSFTKYMSRKMNIPFAEAEKKKLSYSYEEATSESSSEISTCISQAMELWLHGIESLFQNFTGVKTFPSLIYLVGGGAELPDLEKGITDEPWTRSIPFKSPPEFRKILLKDLPIIVDKTGEAQTSIDVLPVALSVVYLEVNGLLDG